MTVHEEHTAIRRLLQALGSTYSYQEDVLPDGRWQHQPVRIVTGTPRRAAAPLRAVAASRASLPAPANHPTALAFAFLGQTGPEPPAAPPRPVPAGEPRPSPLASPPPSAPIAPRSDALAFVLGVSSPDRDRAQTLIADLAQRGHRLYRGSAPDKIAVESAQDASLTDEDRTAIVVLKPELLKILPSRQQDRPANLAVFLGNAPVPREQTDWVPREPPNLDDVRDIVLNFETDGLDWRGAAMPVGVTVGTLDGKIQCYLPFAHRGGGNLDRDAVIRYLRSLRNKRITNANTRFEVHMARKIGVDLEEQGCEVSDVMHWAALLDDHRRKFALDVLAQDYLGGSVVPRVDERIMADFHASQVAARAEYQALLVAQLKEKMCPQLDEQDLQRVRQIEDDVIYAVCEMERNGSKIDVELTQQYHDECQRRHDALMMEMSQECGFPFEHTPAGWKRLLEKLQLEIPDSFKEQVLDEYDHPLIRKGQIAAQYASLDSKTFAAYLKNVNSDGVLHYDINQLRGEDGGTVSGRFSFGLQQVPNHDNHHKAFAEGEPDDCKQGKCPLFPRRVFVPADGDYLESDAMQIEYRLFAHFAENESVLQAYQEDPSMSFHKKTWAMVKQYKPDMLYSHQKNFNFACVAIETPILTADLNWVPVESLKEGDKLLSFNENALGGLGGRGKTRRWEVATVLHNEIEERQCISVFLENEDCLISTVDHPWLVVDNHSHTPHWVQTKDLRPNYQSILKYFDPWTKDESWESGWLAGFLDGEGCVTSLGVTCNQNSGETLEFARKILSSKTSEIKHYPHTGGSTEALYVAGSVHDRIELLGRIRPGRLIRNFVNLLDGKMSQVKSRVRVVGIEPVGLCPIAALGTTSRTYIANGYAAHNTMYGAKIIKLAVMMGFITASEAAEIRSAKRWNDPKLNLIKEISGAFNQAMPEVDQLLERAAHLAKPRCDDYCRKGDQWHRTLKHRGFIRTITGRRSRFPDGYKTYIALNRVLQGSGADYMKRKLYELHRERKHTQLLMRMTLHDAVMGDAREREETRRRVQEVLDAQSFPDLRVLILWETGIGANWAACKH